MLLPLRTLQPHCCRMAVHTAHVATDMVYGLWFMVYSLGL